MEGVANAKYMIRIFTGSINNSNSNYGNIYMSLDTAGATVKLNMQYYKAGTTTPANVTKQFC